MLYIYDIDDLSIDSEIHAESMHELEFTIDDTRTLFAKAPADDPDLLKAIDMHFGGVSVIIGDFAGPLAATAMSLPLPTVAHEVALRIFHELRDEQQQADAFKLLKEDGYITDSDDLIDEGEVNSNDNS